jgi:hypothetical protein
MRPQKNFKCLARDLILIPSAKIGVKNYIFIKPIQFVLAMSKSSVLASLHDLRHDNPFLRCAAYREGDV